MRAGDKGEREVRSRTRSLRGKIVGSRLSMLPGKAQRTWPTFQSVEGTRTFATASGAGAADPAGFSSSTLTHSPLSLRTIFCFPCHRIAMDESLRLMHFIKWAAAVRKGRWIGTNQSDLP